ncbi:MAG: class I SAM-dependent methyltransferase [Bacteroidales bacterium]|nr:MAG: class I SAM-dependent methyltransferase [Bacteroidales bacterium]
MRYDPIKDSLDKVFSRSVFSRKLFYFLLDLLLLRAWYIRKELRKFRSRSGDIAEILDAGAGFGQYSYFMSRLSDNWKITAVEIKSKQVNECNLFFSKIFHKPHVVFEEADLVTYRKAETYDLILCVDVMEHIREDALVFENFYLSLKPGGLLLISTPSDQGGSDVHHDNEVSFVEEHVRNGYGMNELDGKLRDAGFRIIESKYSYGLAGKISWKFSLKYPIMLLNTAKIFFIILPFYYLVTFPFSLLLNLLDVNKKQKTGSGLIVKAWK